MKTSIAGGSSLLIRKKVIEELNGFDETFTRHQDYEFLIRFFENLLFDEKHVLKNRDMHI